MKSFHYINGKIVPENKAVISVNDLGFLRAYGVFDSIRTYGGRPFLLQEHLKRLERSAKLIDLQLPKSKGEIMAIVDKLLKKNRFKEAAIRIYVTGGTTANGITRDYKKNSLIILITEFQELPSALFKEGMKLITTDYQRDNPAAKTLEYSHIVGLQHKKEKAGAFEILYAPDGCVRETGTSNIFMVKNGILVTPKDQVLIGITRNFVIKLAKKAKIKVLERDISLWEMLKADEVFITATNKDIVPVTHIDSHSISGKGVGPVTKRLMQVFHDTVR